MAYKVNIFNQRYSEIRYQMQNGNSFRVAMREFIIEELLTDYQLKIFIRDFTLNVNVSEILQKHF